ncbi:MAG: 23S rRNA (uracil(1939)-C(5))-methyltransferase RlmD [Clostridia bacterium]
MIEKNKIINLSITDTANTGYGVAKLNNNVFFVQNSVCGDQVEALVIKETKNYSVARIEKILSPSKNRIENDCACYKSCGGCTFRHVKYEYEAEIKRQFVIAALKKCGFDNIKVAETEVGNEYNYRNKVQYPISSDKSGNLFCGFFSEYTHNIINADGCKTESTVFANIKNILMKIMTSQNLKPYDETTGSGILRHVYLRTNRIGEVCVCIVINADALPNCEQIADELINKCPAVKSFFVNINKENTNVIMGENTFLIRGKKQLSDVLCGKKFNISPQSFYQVNSDMAERLYEKAKSLLSLDDKQVLLDLYCGIGSIGISIINEKNSLCGVEIIPEAVENARLNASLNELEHNSRFICGDASLGISECKKLFKKIDAIIVDPPRKGLSIEATRGIIASNCKKIVYISCNPNTLARDLRLFNDSGYTFKTVYPFDLFPRTEHVECVVLMTRQEA